MDKLKPLLPTLKEKKRYLVYEVISSRKFGKDAGGKAIVSRVGRSYIYLMSKQEQVLSGSEASSHYYHPEVYYSDSGILTLLKIMELLVREKKPISEVIKPFDIYYHSGEVNIKVEKKDEAIEKIAETFGDGEQSRLDGIGVEYDDVWFNVRKSNTEPLLRIRLEGTSKEVVDRYKEKVLEIIQSI